LYIDETAWKLGKKACYTWVFGTFADVYYRCGVGRGKDVLQDEITKLCKRVNEEIITEKQAQDRGLEVSCITSESDRKLILL